MITQKAKYHLKCLSAFNRKADKNEKKDEGIDKNKYGMAFADIVCYINEVKSNNQQLPVFKLANLVEI